MTTEAEVIRDIQRVFDSAKGPNALNVLRAAPTSPRTAMWFAEVGPTMGADITGWWVLGTYLERPVRGDSRAIDAHTDVIRSWPANQFTQAVRHYEAMILFISGPVGAAMWNAFSEGPDGQ